MPDIISKLLTNVRKFDNPQFVSDLINEAIRLNENEIILLNTQSQIYDKGIRSDGQKIKPKNKPYPIYSKGYESFKKRKGKYRGKVDLNLYGGYLKSYYIQYLFGKFLIGAKDIILTRGFNLSHHLKDFYGNNIEGFTDKNLNKIDYTA